MDVRGSSVRRSLPLILQCIGTNLDQDVSANGVLGTFIFVFMSTMQDKIVGKMFGNVLYHSGIVILPFLVPYVQIRAGFDFCFFNFFLLFRCKGRTPTFLYFLFQKYCGLYAGKYGIENDLETEIIKLERLMGYNSNNRNIMARNKVTGIERGVRTFQTTEA